MMFEMADSIEILFGTIRVIGSELKTIQVLAGEDDLVTIEMLVILYIDRFISDEPTDAKSVLHISEEFQVHIVPNRKAPTIKIDVAPDDITNTLLLRQG